MALTGFIQSAAGQLDRASNLLERVERGMSAALLTSIFVALCVQVFWRYVLGAPLLWPDELARYSMIWLTFLASAFVMARGSHIAVNMLTRLTSPGTARGLQRFALVAVIGAAVAVIYVAVEPLQAWSGRTSTALGVSLGMLVWSPILGFGLMAFHALTNLVSRPIDEGLAALAPGEMLTGSEGNERS